MDALKGKYYNVGRYRLLMPSDHALEQYQATWSRYDKVLGYISEFVFKKYPQSCLIDIGANIGDTAALVRSYSDVAILAIEGSPEFLPYLQYNSSSVPDVECVPCFVGETGSIPLESVRHGAGTASIQGEFVSQPSGQQIPVMPLATILESYPGFKTAKLLKIDTDGFDFSIIRQSLNVISEQLPVLYFEYDISFQPDGPEDAISTIEILTEKGYTNFLIYDNFGNYLLSLSENEVEKFSDLTTYLLSNRFTTGSTAVYYFDVCAFTDRDSDLFNAIRNHELSIGQQARKSLTEVRSASQAMVQSSGASLDLSQNVIVIDAIFFQIANTGIARVWLCLLKEWSKTEFAKNIVVLDRAKTFPRIPGIRCRDFHGYDYGNVENDRKLIQQVCDEENASLFISTYYTTPLSTPSVFIAHDMIPEVMQDDLSDPMWREKHRSIELASLYFSVSNNTARDLNAFFPSVALDSIYVAHWAAAPDFTVASDQDIEQFRSKYAVEKQYFILVGHRVSGSGYKNAILFFKALSKLVDRSNFEVICVGSVTELEPELADCVDGYQVHTLQLNDDDLNAAYSGAIALVYPSKYEGFGLPILEAMTCGCPVITCPVSSIPEVAGDAALFVDPNRIEDMVAAIRKVQRPEVRKSLIEKGIAQSQKFSWTRTANLISERLLETAQKVKIEIEQDLGLTTPIIELLQTFDSRGNDNPDLIHVELREARQLLASYYLSQSADRLKISHLGALGNTYRKLLRLRSILSPLTDFETSFIADLNSRHLNKTINNKLPVLLACMLYQRADQLELYLDFSEIPLWLLEDYINFTCESPSLFLQVGEIDRYVTYMCDILRSLYRNLLLQPGISKWSEVAWMITQRLNAIPLYFSERNVKEYFQIRAKFVEHCLSIRGYQLDWQSLPRSEDRKRIRLGIFASHFTPQTETFATLSLYQSLNRNDFEIILISAHTSNHRLERYCLGQADFNIQLPDELIDRVTCIRDLDLDILFIGTNITAVTNHVLLLAAHRLARIQVTGMNSPTTTGLSSIDYYLSSALVDPQFSVDNHYSETLIPLNSAAQCFEFATEKFLEVEQSISRSDLGIGEDVIVYCSGANFYKITPELEISWAKIIAAVPNAILVLYPFNPNWSDSYPTESFRSRISHTFTRYGIELGRLIILDAVSSRGDVMHRLQLADIYLDSYPFSGMTSLIDPLLLNLPTIVMEMDSACSLARGAAFLRELGADDLISQDEQSYIDCAIHLGTHESFRSQMTSLIQAAMLLRPSFVNSDRYGAEISKAFSQIVEDYQSNAIHRDAKSDEKKLIVFPDWGSDDQTLFETMLVPIRLIVSHEQADRIHLMVYIGDRDPEDADLLMSSVLMHLMIEEGIETGKEGPTIDFLDESGTFDLQDISQTYEHFPFDGEDETLVEVYNML
jgi:FkbM family methyltransferase